LTVEEIRSSGLLESYILGDLTEVQKTELQQYLIEFPELKSDLSQIERVLRAYAEINGVSPRPELKAQIIKSITGNQVPETPTSSITKTGRGPFFLPAILMMVLLGICWYWGKKQSKNLKLLQGEFAVFTEQCDSISLRNEALQNIITNISSSGNRKLDIAPTGSYASTNLSLYLNEDARTNYLQASALPPLGPDEVFQLWSLKDGLAPIPLTVFEGIENQILEVDFEVGTGIYAITIEKSGGSQKPDLSKLIGTIQV
jgi:hypothetical protein